LTVLYILTSEKYEVDLMEAHYKVDGRSLSDGKIDAKKQEIAEQKQRTELELGILSAALVIILSTLLYINYKATRVDS
jgi:hypothetical protein